MKIHDRKMLSTALLCLACVTSLRCHSRNEEPNYPPLPPTPPPPSPAQVERERKQLADEYLRLKTQFDGCQANVVALEKDIKAVKVKLDEFKAANVQSPELAKTLLEKTESLNSAQNSLAQAKTLLSAFTQRYDPVALGVQSISTLPQVAHIGDQVDLPDVQQTVLGFKLATKYHFNSSPKGTLVDDLNSFEKLIAILRLVPPKPEDRIVLARLINVNVATPLQIKAYFDSKEAQARLAEITSYLDKTFIYITPLNNMTGNLSDYNLDDNCFELTIAGMNLEKKKVRIPEDKALALEHCRDAGSLGAIVHFTLLRDQSMTQDGKLTEDVHKKLISVKLVDFSTHPFTELSNWSLLPKLPPATANTELPHPEIQLPKDESKQESSTQPASNQQSPAKPPVIGPPEQCNRVLTLKNKTVVESDSIIHLKGGVRVTLRDKLGGASDFTYSDSDIVAISDPVMIVFKENESVSLSIAVKAIAFPYLGDDGFKIKTASLDALTTFTIFDLQLGIEVCVLDFDVDKELFRVREIRLPGKIERLAKLLTEKGTLANDETRTCRETLRFVTEDMSVTHLRSLVNMLRQFSEIGDTPHAEEIARRIVKEFPKSQEAKDVKYLIEKEPGK